jgi:hypothetical protein
MSSSGVLRCVALVSTGVSEELSASIIRVTRVGELETMLAVTSNRNRPRRNTKYLEFLHRFLHNQSRKNIKPYIDHKFFQH